MTKDGRLFSRLLSNVGNGVVVFEKRGELGAFGSTACGEALVASMLQVRPISDRRTLAVCSIVAFRVLERCVAVSVPVAWLFQRPLALSLTSLLEQLQSRLFSIKTMAFKPFYRQVQFSANFFGSIGSVFL